MAFLLSGDYLIEGVGNEVIFVTSFLGFVLFMILAWLSTRVSSETLPVPINLLPPQWVGSQDSGTASSADNSNQPSLSHDDDVTTQLSRSDDVSSDEDSELSGEDETPVDCGMCLRRRKLHAGGRETEKEPETVSNGEHEDEKSGDVCESPSTADHVPGLIGQRQLTVDGRLKAELQHANRYKAKGHLVLRLQYLDDRTRYVHAPASMSILRFKRKHFAEELSRPDKSVRLIYCGRELLDYTLLAPARTESTGSELEQQQRRRKVQRLADYSLTDSSTIHCLITSSPSGTGSTGDPTQRGINASPHRTGHQGSASSNASLLADFDIGSHLMEPLFAILLVSAWFFRITYRQYFDAFSTCALIVLSLFFFGSVFTTNTVGILLRMFPNWLRRLLTGQASGDASADNVPRDSSRRDIRVVTVTMLARRISPQAPTSTTAAEGNGEGTDSDETAEGAAEPQEVEVASALPSGA